MERSDAERRFGASMFSRQPATRAAPLALLLRFGATRWPRRFVMDHAIGARNLGMPKYANCLRIHATEFRRALHVSGDTERGGALPSHGAGCCRWQGCWLVSGPDGVGPRALGNRSIVCDPRRADMKAILNAKIKRRESFRPFAPSVLAEHVGDWFEEDDDVPFMMQVFQVRAEKRGRFPRSRTSMARAAADRAQRNQSAISPSDRIVSRGAGVPMVLNTSFNENEPVVCQPSEALDCFLRTEMDVSSWPDLSRKVPTLAVVLRGSAATLEEIAARMCPRYSDWPVGPSRSLAIRRQELPAEFTTAILSCDPLVAASFHGLMSSVRLSSTRSPRSVNDRQDGMPIVPGCNDDRDSQRRAPTSQR